MQHPDEVAWKTDGCMRKKKTSIYMILKMCFEHSEIGRNQAKSPYFPIRQTSDTHLISASPIKSIAFHMPECPIS